MTRAIVIATRNAGKLRELRSLFAGIGAEILDLHAAGIPEDVAQEEALEKFATFEENALAKARHFASVAIGHPVIADDSGLEVLALDGAPGVRSKRFAGATGTSAVVDEANTRRLVSVLAGVDDRRARFVCAVAYVGSDGDEIVVRGETTGRIVERPAGTGGFGYDPVFLSDELGRTFGEASAEEKARVSHRTRAFARLVAVLPGNRNPASVPTGR